LAVVGNELVAALLNIAKSIDARAVVNRATRRGGDIGLIAGGGIDAHGVGPSG
jgi:hypothetical protein